MALSPVLSTITTLANIVKMAKDNREMRAELQERWGRLYVVLTEMDKPAHELEARQGEKEGEKKGEEKLTAMNAGIDKFRDVLGDALMLTIEFGAAGE